MDTVDEDRISNLPRELINLILSSLPLRDAVRTSILSTRWRYKWTTIPSLRFGKECHSIFSEDTSEAIYFFIDKEHWSRTLAHMVDSVLILHNGPIQHFEVRNICPIPDIDRWIVHVSRKSIRELKLLIWGTQPYRLPSSLCACESLVKLELFNCVMTTPPSFKGFRSLKHLIFMHVSVTDDAFENLVSSCPLLTDLCLWGIEGNTNLKINAPNLCRVDIKGDFEKLTFGNRLAKVVVICVDLKYSSRIEESEESILIQFFDGLPCVQRFEARDSFLRYLASGNVPKSLPTPCLDLRRLSLSIQFNNVDECLATLCVLRSAPNLKVLEVQSLTDMVGDDEEELGVWMMENNAESHFSLDRLEVLKVEDIVGYKRELEFIKFALLNSPILEEATIITDGDYDTDPRLPVKLLRLRRSSPRAEVIFESPDSDS